MRVFLEEGEMRPGEDLAAKARDARTADIVVVLFSRESMPSRWPRAQWEDALVNEPRAEGVPIAFVRCDDCVPPKVLTPQFTAGQFRELKRWVRGHAPVGQPPERRPGGARHRRRRPARAWSSPTAPTLAAEFAREFRQDFDGVFTLECGGRSLAALAGDLGAQFGLRLEGPLPENLERLRAFCEARRFLIVLEDVPELVPAELVFGGNCSTLATPDARERRPDPIREIQAMLAGRATEWAELCAAARQGRRLLRDAGRSPDSAAVEDVAVHARARARALAESPRGELRGRTPPRARAPPPGARRRRCSAAASAAAARRCRRRSPRPASGGAVGADTSSR